MDDVDSGRTGLEVSRPCLGCMIYGEPDRGDHPWTLGEAESRPFIERALDLGITFFDTANVHSDGSSDEIVGRALLDERPRACLGDAWKRGSPSRAIEAFDGAVITGGRAPIAR